MISRRMTTSVRKIALSKILIAWILATTRRVSAGRFGGSKNQLAQPRLTKRNKIARPRHETLKLRFLLDGGSKKEAQKRPAKDAVSAILSRMKNQQERLEQGMEVSLSTIFSRMKNQQERFEHGMEQVHKQLLLQLSAMRSGLRNQHERLEKGMEQVHDKLLLHAKTFASKTSKHFSMLFVHSIVGVVRVGVGATFLAIFGLDWVMDREDSYFMLPVAKIAVVMGSISLLHHLATKYPWSRSLIGAGIAKISYNSVGEVIKGSLELLMMTFSLCYLGFDLFNSSDFRYPKPRRRT